MFDPRMVSSLSDCGVTLIDQADDVVEVALIYLGFPGSGDLDHLRQAFAMLAEVRPYIRYFHSSQYIDDLANGEVCLCFAWPADVLQAAERVDGEIQLRAVVPKEGSLIWIDYLAIPADAPHPREAHKLIGFLLRPKVAAAFTNSTHYASGNRDATEMVLTSIKENPAIYPSAEMMRKLIRVPERSAGYVRLRNRLWTDLKANAIE